MSYPVTMLRKQAQTDGPLDVRGINWLAALCKLDFSFSGQQSGTVSNLFQQIRSPLVGACE